MNTDRHWIVYLLLFTHFNTYGHSANTYYLSNETNKLGMSWPAADINSDLSGLIKFVYNMENKQTFLKITLNNVPNFIKENRKKSFKKSGDLFIFKFPDKTPHLHSHNKSPGFLAMENKSSTMKSHYIDPGDSYYLESPLKIEIDTNPPSLGLKELIKILRSKKIIFYTGAGISAEKIDTLPTLEKKLFSQKNFLKDILNNPEIYLKIMQNFFESLDSEPTRAHFSLSKISSKLSIPIYTENLDFMHQKAGSNAIFINKELQDNLENLKKIDCIICLGLERDNTGFLRLYKNYNPNGKIIAISLTRPQYLNEDDFYLKEDLQSIIPLVESWL